MFRGRVQLPEIHRVQVKVPVIEPFQYLFRRDLRQDLHIHHIPRLRIRHSRHLDDQLIIMPVIIRIAALPEHFGIFPVIPRGIENAMRRIKMFFTKDRHFLVACTHNYFL